MLSARVSGGQSIAAGSFVSISVSDSTRAEMDGARAVSWG